MSTFDSQRSTFIFLAFVAGIAGAGGPDTDLQAFAFRAARPAAAEIEWQPDAVRLAASTTRRIQVRDFPLSASLSVDLEACCLA